MGCKALQLLLLEIKNENLDVNTSHGEEGRDGGL